MDTFREAREAALEYARKSWRDGDGTLYADKEGREDGLGWLVVVGAREWLVDGDSNYVRLDDSVMVVEKPIGAVVVLNAIEDADRIASMTRVE